MSESLIKKKTHALIYNYNDKVRDINNQISFIIMKINQ